MNANQIHRYIERAQRLINEVLANNAQTQHTGSQWIDFVIPGHSISEVLNAARLVPEHGKKLFEHLVNLSILYHDYNSSIEICSKAVDFNIINRYEYLFRLALVNLNMYKNLDDEKYLRKAGYYIHCLFAQQPEESADVYYVLALYYWLANYPLTSMLVAIHAPSDSKPSGLLFSYIVQVFLDKNESFLLELYKNVVEQLPLDSAYGFSKVWLIYLYFGLLWYDDVGHLIKISLNSDYVKTLLETFPYYTGSYHHKMLKGEVKPVWPPASLN